MGYIKFIVKCFNNFSLKIQISLRIFFQPFLSYGKLKMFGITDEKPVFYGHNQIYFKQWHKPM